MLENLEESSSSYLTANNSPIVTNESLQYSPRYPLLKKNYLTTPSVHTSTVFVRSGLNGFLVPMNLTLVKTSLLEVELAFFEHKSRQYQLRKHAICMCKLIFALRDLLTASFPRENQHSLSFSFINDEIRTLLNLHSEAPGFCEDVRSSWDSLVGWSRGSIFYIKTLNYILESFNATGYSRLPSLAEFPVLDRNVTDLLRLIQTQYHKYFSPEEILSVATDDIMLTQKQDLVNSINKFIHDSSNSKKPGTISRGSICAAVIKQSLINANFLFLTQPKFGWPGLVQALFIDRSSGYFGIVPSYYDDSWKLKTKNSNDKILPNLMSYVKQSCVLFQSGYLFAIYDSGPYKIVCAITLSENCRKFERIDYPADRNGFFMTFNNREQSFVRSSVQNNFRNLLIGKLKPNTDFLHLIELHGVFLRSVPTNCALQVFKDILNNILANVSVQAKL